MRGYKLLVDRFDNGYAKYMRFHPIGGMVFTFFGFPILTLSLMGLFMYAVASVVAFLGALVAIIL